MLVPSSSMTPHKIKISTLKSELLRIWRICYKQKYVDMYDKMLSREFKSKGYRKIDSVLKKTLDNFNTKYDGNFKKIEAEPKLRELIYGSTTSFDSVNNTHAIVHQIIKASLDLKCFDRVCLPMSVPSSKLKQLLHSKKRFLSKLRS